MLPPSFLVVHDSSAGGEDDVAELTGREELDNPFLEVSELDVVTWADDAGLVDAAIQLDDDFAIAMVVNFFELADITVALHNGQELCDDLRRRADHHLPFSTLLGIVDGIERIVEDGGTSHFYGGRFSMALGRVRYLQCGRMS